MGKLCEKNDQSPSGAASFSHALQTATAHLRRTVHALEDPIGELLHASTRPEHQRLSFVKLISPHVVVR